MTRRFVVRYSPRPSLKGEYAIIDTASPQRDPYVVGRAMTHEDAEKRASARNAALTAKTEIDQDAAA